MQNIPEAADARYVMVEAANESQARELGEVAPHGLYADPCERLGRNVPSEIHTVCLPTDNEINLMKWHWRW